jgi:ElaB/YqjD/DUF883 family membrane-anchored ribosome-binding protein
MHNDTPAFTPSLDDGTLQRGLNDVGENLHSTIDRVAQPVHHAVNRVSAGAHQTVDRMASGVAGAAQRLDERIDRVRAAPNELLDGARGYVAARPLKAVAAALAIGWLLGRTSGHR